LGLIDEYRAMVYPVLVGGGIPFFPQRERRVDLELVETRTFSSSVVYLRYRVARWRRGAAGRSPRSQADGRRLMCSSWYSLKVAETHETGGWEWYVAEPVTRRAPAETGSPALIEREQAMPPLVVVTEIDRPPREVFA
jgi:hypothetical protein